MKKIRVLIADDVKILRQGLQAILSQDQEISVVALAEDGKQAFEKSREYRPDVVLMDMRMPEYDGAYGIVAIKRELPKVKVLVLTTFDDDETVQKAINSGADGYILKEMEDSQVLASIKSVYAGISVFGGGIYQQMRNQLQYTKQKAEKTESGCYKSTKSEKIIHFTEREREFLKLVAQGLDNKQIAEKLFLADGTVRNNLSRLLEKIEVKDRTQLAVYAVKNGLDD